MWDRETPPRCCGIWRHWRSFFVDPSTFTENCRAFTLWHPCFLGNHHSSCCNDRAFCISVPPQKKTPCFLCFFFCSQSLCRTLWTNRAGYNRGVVKKFAVAELREDRQTYGLPCGRNRGRYERSQARETKKPDEIPGVARLKHMGPKETGKFGKITPFQSFTCRVSSSFLGCVFFLQ